MKSLIKKIALLGVAAIMLFGIVGLAGCNRFPPAPPQEFPTRVEEFSVRYFNNRFFRYNAIILVSFICGSTLPRIDF